MRSIGIIANPDSGKDIRRLTSSASVFNDREKVNILKRILLALDAMQVERVVLMPDAAGLAHAACSEIAARLHRLEISFLPLPTITGDERDSSRAAELMRKQECACIITLGGDGTNRVVAAACGDTPLLPVSAGTNNVFPYIIEATIAGMAAAVFTHEMTDREHCCQRRPLLELYRGEDYLDMALIDIVVVSQHHVGAGAIWNPKVINELFLARARPGDIGLSSIGACLEPLAPDSGRGMYIKTGSGVRVMAPIAPGLIEAVDVAEYRLLEPAESVPLGTAAGVIALDGEREILMEETERFSIRLNLRGPRVVDIEKTLSFAVSGDLLKQSSSG